MGKNTFLVIQHLKFEAQVFTFDKGIYFPLLLRVQINIGIVPGLEAREKSKQRLVKFIKLI